jgi:hypothetical protein
MVKESKVLKHIWLKNDTTEGGAQAQAIRDLPPTHMAVHSLTTKNGRMWSAMSAEDYLKLLNKNNGHYEIITRFPHKLYFDIDKKGRDDELLPLVIKELSVYFPQADWAVSGSINEIKTSYHLVAQNYMICSEDDRTAIRTVATLLKAANDCYDDKVYTKNRLMKSINQSKPDGRVQEIIVNNDWKAHCITAFLPVNVLPFSFPEEIATDVHIAQNKTFDIKSLPTLAPIELTLSTDPKELTPLELLSLLRIDKSCTYDYTSLVARFCYGHGLTIDQFAAWLKPLHSDSKAIERMWGNLHRYPVVHLPRIYKIIQHFYPSFGKDVHYKRFADMFTLAEQIKEIDTLSPKVFEGPDKYVILNTGMGSGKTAQTVDFLARMKNGKTMLWIAPNRALACNTLNRLDKAGVPFADYAAFKAQDKRDGILKKQDRLLVCVNSLHYISDKTYDIVIIDEPETLWAKYLGTFMEDKKKECWTALVNVLTHAKKVILLDAFTTTATTNLVNMIEQAKLLTSKELFPVKGTTVIYEREVEPTTRTVKYIKDYNKMISDMLNDLKDGKKVFIFYPYKNATKLHKAMESVFKLLETDTGKNGVMYHADQDDTIKAGIKNVNEAWSKVDFVITNNVITCGVNYDNEDILQVFDTVYLFIADYNLPRDIAQVSCRCREVRSNILKVCFVGRRSPSETSIDDRKAMRCPIYSKLIEAKLIEKHAPTRRAFQLFCVKAHYDQKIDASALDTALNAEIDNLLSTYAINVSYSAIDTIDYYEAENIRERLFKETATMRDKYQLQKYFFTNKFETVDCTPHAFIAKMWDDNLVKFVEQLEKVFYNPDHIFNAIAKELGVAQPGLFGVLKEKQMLSAESIKRIFEEFVFKDFTEHTPHHKLLLYSIYHLYFGKDVVCKTKHSSYEVDESYNEVVKFVRDHHVNRNGWKRSEDIEHEPFYESTVKNKKLSVLSFED